MPRAKDCYYDKLITICPRRTANKSFCCGTSETNESLLFLTIPLLNPLQLISHVRYRPIFSCSDRVRLCASEDHLRESWRRKLVELCFQLPSLVLNLKELVQVLQRK